MLQKCLPLAVSAIGPPVFLLRAFRFRQRGPLRGTKISAERARDSFRLLDAEWRICRLRCADREGMNINLAEEEVKEKKRRVLVGAQSFLFDAFPQQRRNAAAFSIDIYLLRFGLFPPPLPLLSSSKRASRNVDDGFFHRKLSLFQRLLYLSFN